MSLMCKGDDKETKLRGRPFLEDVDHSIFVIRGPSRPNHIGLSIVRLIEVKEDEIVFSDIDMINGTPLIDIKPYVSHFDTRDGTENGWVEKHFEDGTVPSRAKKRVANTEP